MKNRLQSTLRIALFVSLITSAISLNAQETEPNNNIGDSGIYTIDTSGVYTGQFQQNGDLDLWYLAPGSYGNITVDIDQPGAPPFIFAAIHCNTGTYGLFGADPNATAVGSATPGSPANVVLDSTKFYTISVASELFTSETYLLTLSGSGALPVELVSFSGSVSEGKVLLNWNTATELNNFGFEILRSTQNAREQWQKIGFVRGNGTTNSPKNYSFADDELVNSNKLYYQLKQIDIDGSFEYSNIIEIVKAPFESFTLEQNYPNPFNPSTKIKFSIPQSAANENTLSVKLKIYDILGNEITTLINENRSAGEYEVEFNAANLSSGFYFYQLKAGIFSETRKMILLR